MAKKKPSKPEKESKRTETEREMYDRFKREFTAADLQKYTEIEEGIPAEQVLAEMEAIYAREMRKRGAGLTMSVPESPRYDIRCSEAIARLLLDLQERAMLIGKGKDFLTSFRNILSGIRTNAPEVGEPLFRLPALRMQVRCVIVLPVALHFALCEDRPLVFIKGAELI